MKKLLALVLALVMVMGLAAVGTNAAYLEDTYTDSDDIEYEEAVAVMSSIGVLEGADNMFRPKVELKRSEAAKIVAYLNTNNKTAEGLIGVGKYKDVPVNHWAAGYIEYLSTLSVVAGNGDNTYNPDGDLKAVDFAKMLLVVLGYDPAIEGLVGNDYKINATKLAVNAGLFNGMPDLKADDVLTREEAAQMAFNTVKGATVEYANKGGEISINGATVSLGASKFHYVTTDIAGDATNISDRKLTNVGDANDSGYTVEFGERQYPKLKLNPDAEDPFGRPANEWTNDKDYVGLFINRDLMQASYHVAVTGADLFDVLGEAKIKNSEEIIYKVNGFRVNYLNPAVGGADYLSVFGVDGDLTEAYRFYGIAASNMIRGNKIPYAFTGNGVLTEVYEKGENIIIVSIYTYYAEVTDDYDERNDELRFEAMAFNKGGAAAGGMALWGNAPAPTFVKGFPTLVKDEDVPGVSKYKDKAKILVRVAYDEFLDEFVAVEVEDPTVKEKVTITKYSTNTIGAANLTEQNAPADISNGFFYEGYIVAGGETTEYSKTVYPRGLMTYANKELDGTFTVVCDTYGYVIYTKPDTSSDKYVFIAGVDNFTSNLGLRSADAFAIFDDGTYGTIKVNTKDTDVNIIAYNATRTGAAANYLLTFREMSGAPDTPLHAYNRWFSYDVDDGVYTLDPAENSLMVAYDAADAINTKGPRLIGNLVDFGTAATGAVSERSAWGNTDSVYITVKTAKVSASDTYQTSNDADPNYRRGIAEVTGIYPSVQSVDLKPYDQGTGDDENPFNEWIYAVYKPGDRYVIAAIVLGENQGADNYIYALDSEGSEEKIGDYYYWDFKAIVDGEQKVLTAKSKHQETFMDGSSITTLKNAVKFGAGITTNTARDGLFKVKIDSDGYVIGAEQVTYVGDVGASKKYETVYSNVQLSGLKASNQTTLDGSTFTTDYAVRYDGEAVYESFFTGTSVPLSSAGSASAANDLADLYYVKGQTLYNKFDVTSDVSGRDWGNVGGSGTGAGFGSIFEEGSDIGLTIATGAPIFVVQQMYIKSNGRLVTNVEEFKDFRTALGRIADFDGNTTGPQDSRRFQGYVSAALNSNGTAKWVVIKNIGTAVNYNNNKVTAGPNVTDKVVTLNDYYSNTGFTVTTTGFTASKSYSVEIRQYAPGQDSYMEIYSGTVSSKFVTLSAGAGFAFGPQAATSLATAWINIDPTVGYSYQVILDGVESNKVQLTQTMATAVYVP